MSTQILKSILFISETQINYVKHNFSESKRRVVHNDGPRIQTW